jgi:predicted PurR-regulated permease PerM
LLGIDPKAARATWTAALIVLLLGLVYLIREVLIVFVIALLIAYLLYPLMELIDRRLTAWKMTAKTRTPALAITFILAIGLFAGLGISVGAVVARQAANLAARAPEFLDRIRDSPASENPIVASIEGQLRQHYGDVAVVVPRVAFSVLSASRNLVYLVIIPILSFLLLKDGKSILEAFIDMLDSGQETAKDTLADVHELLLLYMRALLFLCCATFVSFSVVLSAMRLPYAILLASIAFPLEFIPLVGPLIAAGIIIAVSVVGGYAHVWWVVIYLGLYRLFQDYVLSPHLMSKGVELHPLMIILGVLAGGEIGGIAGIFLSVPALALIRLLYHRARKMRTARRIPVASS